MYDHCKISVDIRSFINGNVNRCFHNLGKVTDKENGRAADFVWFFSLNFFNQLPDNKILNWSKLKQIADDILMCI